LVVRDPFAPALPALPLNLQVTHVLVFMYFVAHFFLRSLFETNMKNMAKEGKEKPARGRKRNRRWPIRIALLLIVVGVLVYCAPWIAAKTELRNKVVADLLPGLKTNIASAEFSWFSPVRLHNAQISDAVGNRLLDAESASTDVTLFDLLFGGTSDVKLTIDRPRLFLMMRADGSNAEDALAQLLADEGDGTPISIEVVDGLISVADADGQVSGEARDVDLTIDYRPANSQPISIRATASIAVGSDESSGQLTFDFGEDEEETVLTAATHSVSLATLAPIIQRFVDNADLQGALTSDIEVRWPTTGEDGAVSVVGKLDAAEVRADALHWIGPDTLSLDRLTADTKLLIYGDRLKISSASIRSDLADLDLRGTLRLDAAAVDVLMADENYHAEGSVNVAKLAERLPQLVKLKDDTHVTSGAITFRLNSAIENDKRRWSGEITTSDLQGETTGQPISWKQPVKIAYDVARLPRGQLGGELNCNSEFLQIVANGTADSATLSAEGDLDQLASSLQQFVDLADVQLAGRFSAAGDLQRDQTQFHGNGHVVFQDLVFAVSDRKPIREPRLTVAIDASGTVAHSRIARVDAAKIRLLSGADRLNLSLKAPVEQPSSNSRWSVGFDVSGKLENWLTRVQDWLPLDGWDIRGGVAATGNVELTPAVATLNNTKAQFTDLRVNGSGLAIAEPRAELTASGSWDKAKSEFRTTEATFASSALSARADELAITFADGSRPRLSGSIAANGELIRLQTWFADWPADVRLAGAFGGQFQLSSIGDATRGTGDITIKQLAVSRPVKTGGDVNILAVVQSQSWIKVWEEPTATFSGAAEYGAASDRLSISQFGIQSKLARVSSAAGAIDQLTSAPVADLKGVLHYDLDVVNDLIAIYSAGNVHVKGGGQREFTFRGPLTPTPSLAGATTGNWLAKIDATGALDWDSIQAYGLSAGSGELAGMMKNGIVQFAPLDLAFTEGRLRSRPMLHFPDSGARLTLGKDSQIQRARITPQLCQSWFQFVAPLLANATRAQGLFSIDLQNGDVPIAVPRDSKLAGNLTIHSAQVSPGPATQQIVSIAQQVDAILRRRTAQPSSTTLNIAEQTVPFEVRDQRVHHRDFHIEVGDVQVRSHGSVGLDATLALVAEIPIRDRWVERDPRLRPLRGQTLKIPIRGTLAKPKVDNRILKDLAKMVAGGAVNNLIDDALNDGLEKGLDKLFKGLKP
jgi:hypothetical protein